jgi:hypothetical protein
MPAATAVAGTTGITTGTVRDAETGKPIAAFHVYLAEPDNLASTTTDMNGRFIFMNATPGQAQVSFVQPNFFPMCVRVIVGADETLSLNLGAQPRHGLRVIEARMCLNRQSIRPGVTADVYDIF